MAGLRGAVSRRGPRLVLALAVLAGLAHAVVFPLRNPAQVGIATDVYHHAAATMVATGSPYGVAPPAHPGFRFLYPPPVAIAATPFGLVGSETAAYALGWLLNLPGAWLLGRLLVRTVERGGVPLAPVDRALLRLAPIATVPGVTTLVLGQVNLLLALGVGVGALLLEGGRDRRTAGQDRDAARTELAAGAVLALPALVKLFPALVGAWLLRVRAWRAVAAATAAGVGALALGVLGLRPGPTVTWLTEVVPGEAAVGAFPDGPDPMAPYVGLRRQLAAVAPGLSRDLLLPVALAVVAPVVAMAARWVTGYRDRLVALGATVLASLLVLPLEPFYVAVALFPVVPLGYLITGRWPRRLVLVGLLLALVPVTYESARLAVTTVGVTALGDPLRAAFAVVRPTDIGLWALLAGFALHGLRATGEAPTAGPGDGDGQPTAGTGD